MIFPQIQLYDLLNHTLGKKVIHVETIYIDEHYSKLLEHVKKHRCKCYCIAPVNYDIINLQFVVGTAREKYASVLKERYDKLKKYADIQMHVHLAVLPQRLSKEEKEHLIKESYNFFVDELKIVPKEIVFGWFASDRESEEIAKSLGLKVIGPHYHLYERNMSGDN